MGIISLFTRSSTLSTDSLSSQSNVKDNGELTHITQEMYKKNFELTEKNKTLSVLQKIDEIIMTSVNDSSEIGKAVTKVLVDDAQFKASAIFAVKNYKFIQTLAIYITPTVYEMHASAINSVYSLPDLSLDQKKNILVQAVLSKDVKQVSNLSDLLQDDMLKGVSQEEIKQIQLEADIQTSFIYPLIVRGQCIGGLVICLSELASELSEYQKDLLTRLHTIIGIAMDNALLYTQVQEANERLKQVDKMKDEFVSLASHELRTPMTAIKSYIWMALDGRGGELSEKLKYYLTRSYMSTNRLINLVNDMLNISRIESDRLTVSMKSVDIFNLCQEVLEEVKPKAEELGLNVSITPPTAPLPNVLADEDKVKEVLINLIGNSMKFTSKGGFVKLELAQNDNMVVVKVIDNGNGMDPTDIPKLFQKFAMLEGSYTANQPIQGTGLGLYICKSLITLHQGTISAFSEGHGKGATFTFTLKIFDQADVVKYSKKGNGSAVGLVHSQI